MRTLVERVIAYSDTDYAKYVEIAGVSTETKPTDGIATGSKFFEVNTGKEYAYDEAGSQWNDVTVSDEAMQAAVAAWLEDNPEATTTVEDGAISYAKLNTSLKSSIDAIAAQSDEIANQRVEYTGSRITSLDTTEIAGYKAFEAVGIPVYVSDVTAYPDYNIAETGWYLFVRITAGNGVVVSSDTTITGAAGYIKTVGAAYVDVAVRFDVAAQSQAVTITWSIGNTETFVFKATDLAVRNLDYRTTFYVYDISEFATWTYTAATDATAVGTAYYTEENGVYTQAAVKAYEEIPANTYYTHSYVLTEDATFQEGTTYYTKSGNVYTAAEVTTGEAVTASTYYVDQYTITTDLTFVGTAYYAEDNGVYTQAAVKAGETPTGLYVHSGVTFEGMARNVTYKCDTVIDCPVIFVLPEIEDEIHGCWYEMRFRHAGSYSSTLQVPAGVKVATEHTQAETAGINMVDLHYTDVGGAKIWRFMNTHSTIPA